MTDREREIVETRAELDARFWRDLYPLGYTDRPSENAVGKSFTYSWTRGWLGDVRCTQEVFEIYYAAYMKYLGFTVGNA